MDIFPLGNTGKGSYYFIGLHRPVKVTYGYLIFLRLFIVFIYFLFVCQTNNDKLCLKTELIHLVNI